MSEAFLQLWYLHHKISKSFESFGLKTNVWSSIKTLKCCFNILIDETELLWIKPFLAVWLRVIYKVAILKSELQKPVKNIVKTIRDEILSKFCHHYFMRFDITDVTIYVLLSKKIILIDTYIRFFIQMIKCIHINQSKMYNII